MARQVVEITPPVMDRISQTVRYIESLRGSSEGPDVQEARASPRFAFVRITDDDEIGPNRFAGVFQELDNTTLWDRNEIPTLNDAEGDQVCTAFHIAGTALSKASSPYFGMIVGQDTVITDHGSGTHPRYTEETYDLVCVFTGGGGGCEDWVVMDPVIDVDCDGKGSIVIDTFAGYKYCAVPV